MDDGVKNNFHSKPKNKSILFSNILDHFFFFFFVNLLPKKKNNRLFFANCLFTWEIVERSSNIESASQVS